MIVKATTGSGFLGTLLYVLHGHREQTEEKHATLIGGNMTGRTARSLSREFGQLRKLRPSLGKAVSHFSLSFSPEERLLRDEELTRIADEFMVEMGFENSAYTVVRHQDTEHQHIHIIGSRAATNGKTVSDSHTFRRAEAAARKLEALYGLIPLKPITTKENAMQTEKHESKSNEYAYGIVDQLVMSDLEVECGEALSDKKSRELRRKTMTAVQYRTRLAELLAPDYSDSRVVDYGLIIVLINGGRLIDRGASVRAYRMDNTKAAKHLVAIGLEKGWQSMKFTGSPDFLRLAFLEALSRGVNVVVKDEEQQAILAAVIAETKQKVARPEETDLTHQTLLETPKDTGNKTLEEELAESARALRAMHLANLRTTRSVPPSEGASPFHFAKRPPMGGLGNLGGRLQSLRDDKEAPQEERKGPRLGPR